MKFRLTQLAVTVATGALVLICLANTREDLGAAEFGAMRGGDIFRKTTNAACEGVVIQGGEVTWEGCPYAGDTTPCVKCVRTIGESKLSSFGLLPGTTGEKGYREKGGVIPCSLYDRFVGVCMEGVCIDYSQMGDCSGGNAPHVIGPHPKTRLAPENARMPRATPRPEPTRSNPGGSDSNTPNRAGRPAPCSS